MDSGRDSVSRKRPLVAAVVAAVVIAGIGTFTIGGTAAMDIDDPIEWSPNPAKEVTPDNETTNDTDEPTTDETNNTTEIDVPACRVNETARSFEPNETAAIVGDDGTTANDTDGPFGTDSTSDTPSNESAFPVGTNGSAQIVFADQNTTGTSVVVESATVPDGGFVVIHDASLLRAGEVEESVIGVSEELDAQQHEDVEVTLARALAENKQLVAVAYRDTDGDGEFRFGDDPYRDDENSAVADDAFVSVLSDGEQPSATDGTDGTTEACPPIENDTDTGSDGTPTNSDPFDGLELDMPAQVVFDDQESNGTAVTTKSATVPEGGYVVIHDASLLQGEVEGSVVGVSERLDSGMHENVTVALNEPLTTEQSLIAVVYRGGDPPDPYTNENGTAVGDDALVSVLGGEGNDSSVTNPSATPNTSEPSVTDAPATTTPADGPFAGTETATTTTTRTAMETTSPAEPFAETETQTRAQTTTAAGATTADAPSNAQTTSTAGRDEQTAGNAGEEETTQTEAPGFGVVSAFAALLSLGLFVVRRQ